jgi:flagellar hook assembly protein FlgD
MIWSGGVIAGGCDDICTDVPDTPVRFSLGLALPNPSRGMMNIAYAVPSPGSHVSMRVYDITGRLAATLVDEHKMSGRYTVGWDGRNSSGRQVAPGTYFVRMEADNFEESSKLILLK